jgi:transcriptional regulator with XRE-family HTH domain
MVEVQLPSTASFGQTVRKMFGARVRVVRRQAGVSQEELALRCGLDRSYIGQVERGERNLTLENIYRIADGLDVPPGSLLQELQGNLDLGLEESGD